MKRNWSVESLRGLAVTLMVAGHVIGTDRTAGLLVEDDSAWRFSYVLLDDIRMPLFAALSGFVYAMRPVSDNGNYRTMVKGKVRRLLVPLVVVGTLFVTFQIIVPGTNGSVGWGMIPYTWVFGYVQFWFLQALFLIFLAVGLLDLFGWLGNRKKWLVATGLSAVAFVAIQVPAVINVFSLDGALRLLPFFLLGYGLNRFGSSITWRPFVVAASATALLGLVATIALMYLDHDPMAVGPRSVNVAFGMAVVYLLITFRDRLRVSALALIGQFAFGIYLFHVFAAAATRIIVTTLGVEANAVLFLVCLAAGILAPMVFECLFGRYAWVSWLLFGQKPRRMSFRLPPQLDKKKEAKPAQVQPLS